MSNAQLSPHNPSIASRGARPGRLIPLAGLLAAGLCLLRAAPGSPLRVERSVVPDHVDAMAGSLNSSAHLAGVPGYRTKNIEDIRVGDRVLADNPDIDSPSETAVNPATWRKLVLRAEQQWDDGTLDDINVETLQPSEWLEAVGVRVGATVPLPLDLVDMGLPDDLWTMVVAIEPCPAIPQGRGRVVLTTVNHLNGYVLELTLRRAEGQKTTIRPTGFHKFYREDDRSWVSAEELQPGDQLHAVQGTIVVVANNRVPGIHRVYNLTVEGEHVYNVGGLGIIAHNTDCGPNLRLVLPPNLEPWEIKAIKDKIARIVKKLKDYPRDPSWTDWLHELQELYRKLARDY